MLQSVTGGAGRWWSNNRAFPPCSPTIRGTKPRMQARHSCKSTAPAGRCAVRTSPQRTLHCQRLLSISSQASCGWTAEPIKPSSRPWTRGRVRRNRRGPGVYGENINLKGNFSPLAAIGPAACAVIDGMAQRQLPYLTMRPRAGRRGEHKRAGIRNALTASFSRGRSGESMPLCQHHEACVAASFDSAAMTAAARRTRSAGTR